MSDELAREQRKREPWRIGSKVGLNVYEGQRPICQCHTREDALEIVAAINLVRSKHHLVDAAKRHADAAMRKELGK